jgi:hypothetical protein
MSPEGRYVGKGQLAFMLRALAARLEPRAKPHTGSARYWVKSRFRHGRKVGKGRV